MSKIPESHREYLEKNVKGIRIVKDNREFVDNPRNIEEKDKLLFDFINDLARKGENGG